MIISMILCLCGWSTGYIIFAIGFADADYGELVNMASKPSERHVFFVDDLDAVKKIEEQLITFVCEAATASKFPLSWETHSVFLIVVNTKKVCTYCMYVK